MVVGRNPRSAELYHIYQRHTVALQLLLQRAFEIFRVYPCTVVFFCDDGIVFLCLAHIYIHISWNSYLCPILNHLLWVNLACKHPLACVLIFHIFVGQGIFVAYWQWQFIVDGINENSIAQYVSIDGKQKRKAAAVYSLEESALAETLHSVTCL